MEIKCENGCMCTSCFESHLQNGCRYGQPDGPDDFYTECDCEEE
jgi:hypothetical protein